jgi:tetratricopeptide (TPR) repeat protein
MSDSVPPTRVFPNPVASATSDETVSSESLPTTGMTASGGSRYLLGQEIARGGMGEVYRATDIVLNREVAVKVLQAKLGPNSSAAGRFNIEARIMGQLQHPGIPPVHDLGTLPDDRPFLAMKLIKGETLETLLKQRGSVEQDRGRFLAVFEQICQAVGYAHAHDVIHRDLKPANIMVGAFGEVQVMDWGLAKNLGSGLLLHEDTTTTLVGKVSLPVEEHNEQLTQSGSVLGTPAYMPPEQARGAIAEIDQRSDVFGLGGILATILTGEPPFLGSSLLTTLELAADSNINDCLLRLERCGAEPELIALCKRCLAPDKADRPMNASKVAAEVASFRADADIRARQAEIREAAGETRRRVLAGSAAAIVLVLCFGIAVSLWLAVRATSAERDTARQLELTEAAEATAKKKSEQLEASLAIVEQRTKFALDAFNNLVFGVQNKLKNQPGTQDLSRELLLEARQGLAKILKDARQQGSPDHTLVSCHLQMGDLEMTLGDTQAAQREYQAGYQLAVGLAEANPSDVQAQRDLSISAGRLGDISLQLGDIRKSLEWYQKGQVVFELLANLAPHDSTFQSDLSIGYNKLGDVVLQLGQAKQALAWYLKALVVIQRLVDEHPKDAEFQRSLVISQNRLGDVSRSLGELEKSLDWYQKGLAAGERLLAAAPQNLDSQRGLGISYERLGDLSLQMSQIAAALDWYQKSLKVSERIAEIDPKNVDAQRDLYLSYMKLGNVTFQQGQAKEALPWYEKSLDLVQRMTTADPTNVVLQRDLSITFEKLGDTTVTLGQSTVARTWFQKMLAARQRLATADSGSTLAQTDLCISYFKLALLEQADYEFAQAITWLEKGQAILEPLQQAQRLNQQQQAWPKLISNQLEYCHTAQKSLASLDSIFALGEQQIPVFLNLRVRALLQKKQTDAAIVTGKRFASWTETVETNRDSQRYKAAACLALCAAGDPPVESLIDLSLELLLKAKMSGYFTPAVISKWKADPDFAGIRQHSKFAAFAKDLDKPHEVAPTPRLKK